MSEPWTAADVPPQAGRKALVTGGNSGIGLQAATVLAGAGARVLIGCRNPERAARALEAIRDTHPDADVDSVQLDLADLASVAAAAEQVAGDPGPLDLLINNAGVMATPERRTADGFELQLGTNHLGHFALTGRLLRELLAAPQARVVSLASLAHRQGRMDFDDLNWERGYSRIGAYGRSKLANLLFTFELDRRLRGAAAIAVACHPGYAATHLQTSGPGEGRLGAVISPAFRVLNQVFAQSDRMGALPTLYAATAPDVEGSDYIGPSGFAEARGHPHKVGCSPAARSPEDARRLWEVSIELTGVGFEPLEAT